jgi:PIN domain nuclease of toxin-antitoxin system
MASVLLDTHILIWWLLDSRRLGTEQVRILEALESRGEPLAISAITLWEIAVMVARGRLEIADSLDNWLDQIETHPLIVVMPLTARIAAEGARLGEDFQEDPADRMIVATARVHGLRLLTVDNRIRRWAKVPIV